jgi:hypothetical protein
MFGGYYFIIINILMLFTHQELGTRLKLFFMDETSPGSIFWLPHGAHIYNRLVEYIRYYYSLNGYSEVIGPNIYDKKLWETSGHWNVYRENMFIIEQGRYTEDNEAGKEVGKEAGKEEGKDAGKEEGKEEGKEAGKEEGKEAGKEEGKDAGKEAGKEAGKDPNKKLFSLKPMNCVSGDVVVGTAHNFSVRMVCLEDFKKMSVIGFNNISKNIEYTDQTKFHSNGVKKCIKLEFLDGRSIVCTPDHYISTPDGWVMAKDLVMGSNVHFVPTPPLILPYNNPNWLTVLARINKHLITLSMNNETEISKTFAFARLCGFLSFAGFQIDNSYRVYTEHMHALDIEQLENDISILENIRYVARRGTTTIYIRDRLYEIINGVMSSGLRSMFCTFNIPDFLFNADTPQDVICQYLSGLLGGVNTENDCILRTQQDIKIKLRSSIHRRSNIMNAVEKLISLFNIVGIKNCSYLMYTNSSCVLAKIHCILKIPYVAIPYLTKYIGVSYNFKRSMRLCTINSYLNYINKNRLDRIQLDSFEDYIYNINAGPYFRRRPIADAKYARPLCVPLVGRKSVGNKLVYDITVNPAIQSFSANGILVHNCPSHCIMFDRMHPSYKDLPIRLAEFGVLHRHEASGALNGLLRVRRFQQDDSHIFCTLDQVENEVLEVLNFVDHTYNLFGMKYKVYVSTRPDKYIGDLDTWNKAEEILKKCVQSYKPSKLNIKEGDGAFYGPKIDIALVDGKNRESQCGTIQLDFNLPASDRFNLLYRDVDQQMKHPIIIHRAVLGSIERFIGIILENTQGKLPLWLSPRQIGITTVNKEYNEYASTVQKKIKSLLPQVVVDFDKNTTDDLRNQIKMMETLKYNIIITLGEKEQTDNTLTVRIGKQRLTSSIEEFVAQVTSMLDEYKI